MHAACCATLLCMLWLAHHARWSSLADLCCLLHCACCTMVGRHLLDTSAIGMACALAARDTAGKRLGLRRGPLAGYTEGVMSIGIYLTVLVHSRSTCCGISRLGTRLPSALSHFATLLVSMHAVACIDTRCQALCVAYFTAFASPSIAYQDACTCARECLSPSVCAQTM